MFRFRPHIFLAAVCAVFNSGVSGQYWMQKGGSVTIDEGYDISVDDNGNTYTTGYFTGTASFGSFSLVSAGSTDIFVVKTNDQGVYQWAVRAGGPGSDRGLSIASDAQGNSYVTGYFSGSSGFGSTTLTSEGLQDVFIAKYNSSGVLQWVKQAGGSNSDIGNGITLDNSGNAIVTGEFKDSCSFGATTLVSANNSTDVFITKLNSSGTFQWTQQGSGNNTDRGLDVACDASGNIYATGQFSTTITFDVTHANTMFNVIYVIKFNGSGQEQWFRIIGAGSSNIANSIVSDEEGNTYITGDFTGTVTFFGTTNTNLGNAFDKRIFIARYDNSGTLDWATSAGSDSDISSRSIAIDASGSAFIVGHFKCRLDEYSLEYGSGTFCSVGFSDVFISKYDSLGEWQYSRNLGSHEDDYGYGVAINASGEALYTGSFRDSLNVPVSANFLSANLSNWDEVSCTQNASYCSDADYGDFYTMISAGNSDVVIANCFDPGRAPYDFYKREGSGCNRDSLEVCIEPNCPDSAFFCNGPYYLDAFSHVCRYIGPDYATYQLSGRWLWSNFHSEPQNAQYTSEGFKWVKLESPDGCFVSVDSIRINQDGPAPPTITDDEGINVNAAPTTPIAICGPDTVTLTAGGYTSNSTILWTGPGLGSGSSSQSISVHQSGPFVLHVTDSNGCGSSTIVNVSIHFLPPFKLMITVPDTITMCENTSFEVWMYDSVANPNGGEDCFTMLPYNVSNTISISPGVSATDSLCETNYFFWPTDSGLYTISDTLIRYTPCDTDTHVVIKAVFLQVKPAPVVLPFTVNITGRNYYCPGDSTLLVASGSTVYSWTGTNINGNTNDSVYVSAHDFYKVQSTISLTNEYGCSDSHTDQAEICVGEKPQPEVTANTYLLCPNDSVLLTCAHDHILPPPCDFPLYSFFTGIYSWEGPSGPIAGNTSAIYVTEPGQYFCTFNDTDSCALLSNTVTVLQYTTPSLIANGDLVLCEGDSVTISVVANEGSLVEWQAPLSGTGLQQTVYEAGIYTCKITSCNIETYASVEVLASGVAAEIEMSRELCTGDTIVLYGSPGMDTYLWAPGGQTTDSILVSEPGTFSLETTDTNGCSAASDPVTVVIEQVPTVIGLDTITTFCHGDSVILTGNDSMQSYSWAPSGKTTQTIAVYTAGLVILTTLDTNGCKGSDSVTLYIPDTTVSVNIAGDTMFCEGGVVILNAAATGPGFAGYTWQPGGQQGPALIVDSTGTYYLTTVDTFGCEAYSRMVHVYVEPHILSKPLVSDTLICAGTAVTLHAMAAHGEVQWYDEFGHTFLGTGEEFTTPVLTENTTYYVWAASSFCTGASVPLLVEVEDCDNIAVPNVFTPNGDGINDLFRISMSQHKCFNCRIYNRWGMLVYEMPHINFGWDGMVAGEPASEGTYYYKVEYCKHTGESFTQQGSFTLIRESTETH